MEREQRLQSPSQATPFIYQANESTDDDFYSKRPA
ncbi:hypothetical protein A1122_02965 [Yersinia pestis A1122]|nr:hypothetical protein YPC_4170 [Yersinia pestis biovar Medievalis str. Harbin 35]AEL71270.1 hypothetical protein A1122_02965 [Yersinia pestis A1122]EEO78081.1 hypothetical protein YP516_0300 [Yersinia pestis Nepal516]EEO82752.1 hypothetical protein YPF_0725 [Yersinia pestis biovar Orientalis str. India 195]EEO86722.1 hypothetical protein YPH_2644 [Yersinia pestis biovar Orientalis str. PEXU2]EEO91945.1 hypothetical protein YPS_0892 [Yersinia pestis Pestoides A]QOW15912.1 hypothetical protei